VAGRCWKTGGTCAKGLDDRGRAIVIPGTEPSVEGTLLWPNLNGGTVWFSPSYSPRTGFFYMAVREIGSIYYKREANYKPGSFFAGGEAMAPGTGEARVHSRVGRLPAGRCDGSSPCTRRRGPECCRRQAGWSLAAAMK
jgi:hypothetical protein